MVEKFHRELGGEANSVAVIGETTKSGSGYVLFMSRNSYSTHDIDELISTLQEAKLKTEGEAMMAGWSFARTKLGEFAAKEDGDHFARVRISNGRLSATDIPLEVLQAAIEKYNSLPAEEQGVMEMETE